eukprot:CAMPEP_0173114086 /NCGR_PEP_ID=MMETSP1102-20130122/47371_1 /TAXON_ID=49646 /ORGANISM="Geminigera sp., Strain Caron Lab Isolate" /LENGTH=142 /DNA_ID=CAMNT_0014016215 /DNA_START=178 /DNA_END=602 /DNA_ORIENTATION=-
MGPSDAPGGFKLFVGGIPFIWEDHHLSDYFMKLGPVTSAKVILEKDGGPSAGKSRGFGFVTYAHPEDGKRAIADMNDSQIEGRKVTVKVAVERGEEGAPRPRYDAGGRGGGSRGHSDRPSYDNRSAGGGYSDRGGGAGAYDR